MDLIRVVPSICWAGNSLSVVLFILHGMFFSINDIHAFGRNAID